MITVIINKGIRHEEMGECRLVSMEISMAFPPIEGLRVILPGCSYPERVKKITYHLDGHYECELEPDDFYVDWDKNYRSGYEDNGWIVGPGRGF